MMTHCRLVCLATALSLVTIGSVSSADTPTGFIENLGQVNEAVEYYALGPRAAVYFTQGAVVLDLKGEALGGLLPSSAGVCLSEDVIDNQSMHRERHGCALYICFEGANPSPVIEARGEIETKYSYLLGNDPSCWRTDVAVYREVVYHDLWPGVDLMYYHDGNRLAYEMDISPGADPNWIRFRYEGADLVTEMPGGSFVIETQVGSVREMPSGLDGKTRVFVLAPGNCEILGDEGSPVSTKDNSALLWSTFLGGGDGDYGLDLVLDPLGNVLLTGYVWSPDFPITPGAYDASHNGDWDVIVAKISHSGSTLLWSTFLGGSSWDWLSALALDSAGNAVVTGRTNSSDFPTTPGAYDPSYNGNWDVFVAKISSLGDSLLWSTFLGANNAASFPYDLVLDSSENPVVTGYTNSSIFPTTPGAYDTSFNGNNDAFAAKISSLGDALIWSTFLGGESDDQGYAVDLDASGNVVLTGRTYSSDFPTTPGAYDTSHNGKYDVFLAELSPSGSTLAWSTLLGGSGDEQGHALVTDPFGNTILAGVTKSSDFPTTSGAYDTSFNGGVYDVFVSKISGSGSVLLWSTFLGGSGDDYVRGLSLDSSGNPLVVGDTESSDFPTTPDGYDTSYNGGRDALIANLASSADALLWSTFLGGSGNDYGHRLALDSLGNGFATGETFSADFPTTPSVYDTSHNGNYDIFVARIDLAGVSSVDARDPESASEVICLSVPTPFKPSMSMQIRLLKAQRVSIVLYDVDGRLIRRLLDGLRDAGAHNVQWNGDNEAGEEAAPGVYLCRVEADTFRTTRKVVLLR
jgi:hypothetical protein